MKILRRGGHMAGDSSWTDQEGRLTPTCLPYRGRDGERLVSKRIV
jgi:hypothetical protein